MNPNTDKCPKCGTIGINLLTIHEGNDMQFGCRNTKCWHNWGAIDLGATLKEARNKNAQTPQR